MSAENKIKTYIQNSTLNLSFDTQLEWHNTHKKTQLNHIMYSSELKAICWFQGTYIKNGPARTTFGGEHQYHNLADGWAKLHKFNVFPDGLQYTGKFLKTPIYEKCVEAQDIVPSFTMGPITPGKYLLLCPIHLIFKMF